MTEVIQYQATDITASDYETFDECAERILKATRRRLRYKDPDNPANLDGIPIEIDPKRRIPCRVQSRFFVCRCPVQTPLGAVRECVLATNGRSGCRPSFCLWRLPDR